MAGTGGEGCLFDSFSVNDRGCRLLLVPRYTICVKCCYLVSLSIMCVLVFFEESLDRGLGFSLVIEHLEWVARASVLG